MPTPSLQSLVKSPHTHKLLLVVPPVENRKLPLQHAVLQQSLPHLFDRLPCVRRLPVHLHEVLMKVRKVEKELADELQREPSSEEVAKAAGITGVKLHSLRKVCTATHLLCCLSCTISLLTACTQSAQTVCSLLNVVTVMFRQNSCVIC